MTFDVSAAIADDMPSAVAEAPFPMLPAKMRKAREDAGLTQEQVASEMRKSRAAISSWESGAELPRLIHIKHFAKICKTTVSYLVSGE